MRRDVQSAGDSRPCFAFLPIAHALSLAREIPSFRSFSLLFILSPRVARFYQQLLDRSRSSAKETVIGRDETRGCGGRASISRISLDIRVAGDTR